MDQRRSLQNGNPTSNNTVGNDDDYWWEEYGIFPGLMQAAQQEIPLEDEVFWIDRHGDDGVEVRLVAAPGYYANAGLFWPEERLREDDFYENTDYPDPYDSGHEGSVPERQAEAPVERRSVKRKATDALEVGEPSASLLILKCPVCRDQLDEKQVVATDCGHLTCNECMRTILSGRYGRKCPTCRKNIRLNTVRNLYF